MVAPVFAQDFLNKKNSMMKNTARSETCGSMSQAASRWGIPKLVMQVAKRAGCGAFVGSRVHRTPLEAWILANPGQAQAAKVQARERQALSALQLEKLRLEVRLLNAKNDRLEAETINRQAASDEWDRAHRIDCEEAQAILPPDHYQIYVARTASRIGVLFGEQTTTNTKP